MELAALVVAIVLVVILVSRVTPAGIPTPIALLVVGAVLSFVPGVPEVRLSSELVLYGLLPPLLYAAALSTSLLDVSAHRGAILSLSVGLVLFTAAGVAVVAWLLLPISFALALALGAIVAPPDAVAATSVARRIGLPRRITTILEGESLLNDATALVTLRTALAAAGLVAHGAGSIGEEAPEVTVSSVGIDLLIASVGGVAIGVLAFLVIGLLRKHLTEVPADTALSFVAPYLAYVPAEQVGASGVLAVVPPGCCSRTGRRSSRPHRRGCRRRSTGRASPSSSRTRCSCSSGCRSRGCSTTWSTTTSSPSAAPSWSASPCS